MNKEMKKIGSFFFYLINIQTKMKFNENSNSPILKTCE